ncbi:hypothetical protein [Rhodanobacter lindaniclasticus]
MTFANATSVSGSGTIANVAGGFADNTGLSSASNIIYSGFGAVAGTGGNVTGVTGSFDLGTKTSAASGINYGGFNVTTLSGSGTGATIAGGGPSTYTLDNTIANQGSSGGVAWTGFGNLTDTGGTVLFGTGGSLSGNVTAATLNYGSYGSAVTLGTWLTAAARPRVSAAWGGRGDGHGQRQCRHHGQQHICAERCQCGHGGRRQLRRLHGSRRGHCHRCRGLRQHQQAAWASPSPTPRA